MPVASAGSRQQANRLFWLVCVVTSVFSVVILLTLLLSIAVQAWPVFLPSEARYAAAIKAAEKELISLSEQLESEKVAGQAAKRDASDSQQSTQSIISQLEIKLEALQEAKSELSGSFLSKPPSPNPGAAGIGPALLGSIWVCLGCTLFFLPLGVGTAIFLEEFQPRNGFLRWLSGLLQLNISNLAGVPSIVYGILGVTAFAAMFGYFGSPEDPVFEIGSRFKRQYVTEGMQVVFVPTEDRDEIPAISDGMTAYQSDGTQVTLNIIDDNDEFPEDDATLNVSLFPDAEGGVVVDHAWYSFRLPFGRSVLTASLTLMLVILPVVIIATQESLRSVPSSLRAAALGLGCTPWQTVRNVTLPAALPGIMTASILAMSRAVGEAAPILMISGIVSIAAGPKHFMDDFSILPLQIFYWAGLPEKHAPIDFPNISAAAIIVLLVVLFAFNSVAILIRQMAQKRLM